MTAADYPFDPAFFDPVANDIVNECRSVNRVTYDIPSKPPAAIVWE